MTVEYVPIIVPVIASSVITALITSMQDKDSIPWYDYINNYYRFPVEYTTIIDDLLIKHGHVGPKEMLSLNGFRPAIGKHYFYLKHNISPSWNRGKIRWGFKSIQKAGHEYWFKIIFEKKILKQGDKNKDNYYYMCYVAIGNTQTFEDSLKKMFTVPRNEILTISIDTSGYDATPFYMRKKYAEPKPNQLEVAKKVFEWYRESQSNNVKVLIHGNMGTGKTFCGRVVKKYLEAKDNVMVKLYDDFNPMTPGCNVKSLILRNANKHTPIIIVLDEMDIIYENAITEKQMFGDSRILHTQNKKSLNSMLDAIGDVPNVIAIYTTEKSPSSLYKKEKLRSFFRPGRVDHTVELTEDQAIFDKPYKFDKSKKF